MDQSHNANHVKKNIEKKYYIENRDSELECYKKHYNENQDKIEKYRSDNKDKRNQYFRKRIRNQKVIENDNDELIVKNYPKNKQPVIQQQKFKPPSCPSCKRNNWLQFDKGYYSKNCEYIINKEKHQIDKKSS